MEGMFVVSVKLFQRGSCLQSCTKSGYSCFGYFDMLFYTWSCQHKTGQCQYNNFGLYSKDYETK